MESERTTMTRRRLLAGAAAVGAGGALAGAAPGLASAAAQPQWWREPLWKVAWRQGIVYGGSISTWMFQPDPAYARLFGRQVAMLWPEDDFLWYRLRPSPTSGLKWKYPDLIVEFAERNHQLVIGAPGLVWDQGFGPGWTHHDLWSMSKKQASHVLFSTVRAIVRRYRGRAVAWLVCNEVTDPAGKNGLRTDVPWYHTIGPGYVAEAFHVAHEADPHALLLLNEFGFQTVDQYGDKPVPRQKATLEVLDTLLADHVPVHGLGIESHLLATDFPSRFHEREFRFFLRELADRGLKIVISEMDVLDNGLPKAIRPRDRGVADVYFRYLDTVLEESDVIAVIQYGLSDRWTEENQDNPRPDGLPRRPCPFDKALRPKPAFYAINDALGDAPRRHPYWVPPKV
jgi:endo-1,4-beta-xylanase